ncbi:hypothetical protein C4578_04050 [Candidatus Microgenomates bacterium]|nr:MAG: hypothetical protein C4578_04050 [Candidatus Microgenomates bacterium]
MRKRDLAILNDLTRFRCLTRDDIVNLHFSGLKNAVTCCNTVLKRLRRDGQIEANTTMQPYIYFLSPSPIKKDSAKIPHFLKIAQFYQQIQKLEDPRTFIVEPKYGKGFMEPDAFMVWKRAPFFVEIQRSVYSERTMNEKVKRYEAYYHSREWEKESWQPRDKKVFPRILVLSDTRYKIESTLRFFQAQNIEDFIQSVQAPKQVPKEPSGVIKVNSGNMRFQTP